MKFCFQFVFYISSLLVGRVAYSQIDSSGENSIGDFSKYIIHDRFNPPIYFKSESIEIGRKDSLLLDTIIIALKSDSNLIIEIGGHTDSIESSKFGYSLSSLRSELITFYLIQRGISPNRIISKAYSDSQPISVNTEEGRTYNRRVSFSFSTKIK